jgi:hypothetical protein
VRRPKTTPVHELERYMRCPPVLRSPRLSLQAKPSGRAAPHRHHGERSAVNVVGGRTEMRWSSLAYCAALVALTTLLVVGGVTPWLSVPIGALPRTGQPSALAPYGVWRIFVLPRGVYTKRRRLR